MNTLNKKQIFFCNEYLIDLNGTKAAIRAGYSENGARVRASELLTNSNIQEKIQQLKKERIERLNIDADEVLRQLYNFAFADITNFVNIETVNNEGKTEQVVTVKDTSNLDSGLKAAIASIKQDKHGINISMQNRDAAIDKLMRHLGLYENDNKQQVPQKYDLSILSDNELTQYLNIIKKLQRNRTSL